MDYSRVSIASVSTEVVKIDTKTATLRLGIKASQFNAFVEAVFITAKIKDEDKGDEILIDNVSCVDLIYLALLDGTPVYDTKSGLIKYFDIQIAVNGHLDLDYNRYIELTLKDIPASSEFSIHNERTEKTTRLVKNYITRILPVSSSRILDVKDVETMIFDKGDISQVIKQTNRNSSFTFDTLNLEIETYKNMSKNPLRDVTEYLPTTDFMHLNRGSFATKSLDLVVSKETTITLLTYKAIR